MASRLNTFSEFVTLLEDRDKKYESLRSNPKPSYLLWRNVAFEYVGQNADILLTIMRESQKPGAGFVRKSVGGPGERRTRPRSSIGVP